MFVIDDAICDNEGGCAWAPKCALQDVAICVNEVGCAWAPCVVAMCVHEAVKFLPLINSVNGIPLLSKSVRRGYCPLFLWSVQGGWAFAQLVPYPFVSFYLC